MVKLFGDLKVGDSIYWVHEDKWNKIYVEEYKILDICTCGKNIKRICVKYHGSYWKISLKATERSHQREDGSYFVMDEEGIKWAVRKRKEQIINEFTKQIDGIRKKMTDIILDDYEMLNI